MKFFSYAVVPVLVFLLTAFVLEWQLRGIENPHRFLSPDCVELGGAYHHRYKANCSTSTIYFGARVRYAYNELGVRDRPVSQLSGKPRVIVMGDSNAEGWGIDEEVTITRRLESQFGGRFIFVNAAMRFAGPVLHALRLRELMAAYRPSAVLWLLTEKDYGYDRFADSLSLERDAAGFPTSFSQDDVSSMALFMKGLEAWIPGRSYLLEYLAQGATLRRIRTILHRPQAAAFEPCRGVERLLAEAAKNRIPVLPVLMPIGPNYFFDEDLPRFAETWACLKRASAEAPLDARIEALQSKDLMLPNDSHFNARGTAAFASFLRPRLEEFLRKIPAVPQAKAP